MLNQVNNYTHSKQSGNVDNISLPDDIAWLKPISSLEELEIHYDRGGKTMWEFMRPMGRPSFTTGLLRDSLHVLDTIENAYRTLAEPPVEYMILGSRMPGAFNLGGDLAWFHKLIIAGDRESLRRYAYSCIEAQYRCGTRMNLPLCLIALVQGDALGGGFEVALSHDFIIAERSARFGLPEILFNLFPGMGAYSFLSRRLDSSRAQKLMTSGLVYSAEEMHELGIVDAIAEDGQGVDAAQQFVDEHRRSRKSRLAVSRLRNLVSPLTFEELATIADLWVETALTLDERDLRRMRHLAAAQDRRSPHLREARSAHQIIA
jgi:DSF synthase